LDKSTTSELININNDLTQIAIPILEKHESKSNPLSQEAKKLDNLTKNIFDEVNNNKTFKDMSESEKDKILDIAKDAEEWLAKNKGASDQQIKDYMNGMWKLLGTHTNYKFSVWTVGNYGMGFGFSEQTRWGKNSGLKKDYSHYATNFITKGNTSQNTNNGSKGYSGYKGKDFDNLSKIPKNISKEEKEALDKFDKLKQNKGDISNTEIGSSVSNSSKPSGGSITYSYDDLKNMKDLKNREKMLSDEVFRDLFNMTKREFERLPIFQQHSIKKKLGLY